MTASELTQARVDRIRAHIYAAIKELHEDPNQREIRKALAKSTICDTDLRVRQMIEACANMSAFPVKYDTE